MKEEKTSGSKTPDFLWSGRHWELKGVTSKNSVDCAMRDAAKQIQSIPGGIILDTSGSSLTDTEIADSIADRIKGTALMSVDVLIVSDEKLKKILRYRK